MKTILKLSVYFLSLIIIFSFTQCNKNIPKLDLAYQTEGLLVTISGSVTNTDESISKLTIDWGDSKSVELANINFSEIEEKHKYSEPSTYEIIIKAQNIDGDSTIQSFTITVDYMEATLDNIKSTMFKTTENEFLILTVNLHTYQETDQIQKFEFLSDVIAEMDIDFVAFQECAQHKSSPIVSGIIRDDNMAMIISSKLKENYNVDYNYQWDWAHYGWDVWEEGVAVLSKYQSIDTDSKYISTITASNNITSRKVIYGSYQTPKGIINFFSAHTHWRTTTTDEEQNIQINNIKLMVSEKETVNTLPSFVCGDFNVNPTSDYPWSEGYNTMVLNNIFIDTFLKIYTDANTKPALSIYNTIGGDFPGRIDYIFMKNNSHFTIEDSQIIFTKNIIGTISDHYAVITKIKFVE